MSLHADIIGVIRARNFTIAFAESCTGGRLSADLTTVPGSSDVVTDSAVCYQTRTKNVYRSFVEFKHVHIDAHPSNDTEIHWAEISWPDPTEKNEEQSSENSDE